MFPGCAGSGGSDGVGAAALGASSVGADVGSGVVCARPAAQSNAVRSDVDASKRAGNNTESPRSFGETRNN
jgi:hypothetical protein